MPLSYVWAGPQRALLHKLRERLEEFSQGRGRYYPGYGLNEGQSQTVELMLVLLEDLLDERIPPAPTGG